MKRSRFVLLAGLVIVLILLALVAAPAGSQSFAGPNEPGTKHDTSINWSGYVVESDFSNPKSGVVEDVKATWVVPTVTGGTSNAYSSTWIGIDGWSSRTVEQIGTEQDWVNGQAVYSAWWETYPKPSHRLSSTLYPVSPGDVMHAEVRWVSGTKSFELTLEDVTADWDFAITQKVANAQRQSAEWVVEGALLGRFAFPLANFNTTYFTNAQVTISGDTGSVEDGNWQYQPITLVSSDGQTVRAKPENLSSSGDLSSFDVLWQNP